MMYYSFRKSDKEKKVYKSNKINFAMVIHKKISIELETFFDHKLYYILIGFLFVHFLLYGKVEIENKSL